MPPSLPEKPTGIETLEGDIDAEIKQLKDVRSDLETALSDSAALATDVAKVSAVVKEVGEVLTVLVFIPGVGPEIAAVGASMVAIGTVVGAAATHWTQIEADVKEVDKALGDLIIALEETKTAEGKLRLIGEAMEKTFESIKEKVEQGAEWAATELEVTWKKIAGMFESGKTDAKGKRAKVVTTRQNAPLTIKSMANDILKVAQDALAAGEKFFEAPAKPDTKSGVELAAADLQSAAGTVHTLKDTLTKGISDGDEIASGVKTGAEVAEYIGKALEAGSVIPVIGGDLVIVGKALVTGGTAVEMVATDWAEVKKGLEAVETLLATAETGLTELAKAVSAFETEKTKVETEYTAIAKLVAEGKDWQALETGWTDVVDLFDDAKSAVQEAQSTWNTSASSVSTSVSTLKTLLKL